FGRATRLVIVCHGTTFSRGRGSAMLNTILTITMCLFMLTLNGCALISPQPTPPRETPTTPHELQVLPRKAHIGSANDPKLGSCKLDVNVWELPGITPPDKNSVYMGDRGKLLGVLACHEEVAIMRLAWSNTDQEFWAFVKSSGSLEGWIPLNLLDLTP
ncbi:MAG: hypothetical protein WBV59_03565, partial [Anaerolineae bacterium]